MGVKRWLIPAARGVLALRSPVGQHTLGLVMAFGAGVLISAVAYELVEDSFGIAGGSGAVALGLFAGAFAFYFGDLAIDRFEGEERKSAAGVRMRVRPSPSCSVHRCSKAGGFQVRAKCVAPRRSGRWICQREVRG